MKNQDKNLSSKKEIQLIRNFINIINEKNQNLISFS